MLFPKSHAALVIGLTILTLSPAALAGPSHGNAAGNKAGKPPSAIAVQDNDWSTETDISDCDTGWAAAFADDSWSVTLTNPTVMIVTATDEFCVGDYYNVFRDGTSMGTTPNPGVWGCDQSGTLSSGSFTKTVKAGTYQITVKDLGFRGRSREEIADAGMCPAGFNVSGSVTPVRPTSEKTAFQGWSPDYPTAGMWEQTLAPAGTDFSGETVQEADPGGGGPDTCWFSGSAIDPQIKITGGTWTVQAGNQWGFDYVGWLPPGVTYYRNAGRAPCGTTFPQQMTIQAAIDVAKGTGFVNYPVVNALSMTIEKNKVTSTRAGVTKSRLWP